MCIIRCVYKWPSAHSSNDYVLVILLAGALLGVCILILAAMLCVNRIKLRRKWKEGLEIKNGLIVSIGIGEYGPRPLNAEAPGFLTNLSVGTDVNNLRQFADYLNFPFYTVNDKLSWSKAEVMTFLDEAIGTHFFDEKGKSRHDGLIVAISSHGFGNSMISSDYEMINRTEIHRSISEKYPQIRVIPRIFIFDACDGTRDRKTTMDLQSSNVEIVEANKGDNDTVQALQMETEWTSRTKNPDYNLAVVHGANDGFVSKMQNSEVGSYLTYCFIKMVKERIKRKARQGLSDILVEIQDTLHDKGKQMIKFICFNKMGNLRIERKDDRVSTYESPSLEMS